MFQQLVGASTRAALRRHPVGGRRLLEDYALQTNIPVGKLIGVCPRRLRWLTGRHALLLLFGSAWQ